MSRRDIGAFYPRLDPAVRIAGRCRGAETNLRTARRRACISIERRATSVRPGVGVMGALTPRSVSTTTVLWLVRAYRTIHRHSATTLQCAPSRHHGSVPRNTGHISSQLQSLRGRRLAALGAGCPVSDSRTVSCRRTSRCSGSGRRRGIGVESRRRLGGGQTAERQGVGRTGEAARWAQLWTMLSPCGRVIT